MNQTEHYRQTLNAADALWGRLEKAQAERLGGVDPKGVAFRQVDAEVRVGVARLWRDHDAFLGG